MARGPAADASPPPWAAQSGWRLTSARLQSGWLQHGGLGRYGQASPECLLPWRGIICSHTPSLQKAHSLWRAAPEVLCVPSTQRRRQWSLGASWGLCIFWLWEPSVGHGMACAQVKTMGWVP